MALVARSKSFGKERAKCLSPPITIGGVVARDRATMAAALASSSHEAVDGRSLRASADVPYAHNWVSDGTSLMSGSGFINAIQIVGGDTYSCCPWSPWGKHEI